MPEIIKNIIRGAGTIIQMFPPPIEEIDRRPQKVSAPRMNDWQVVGYHIESAIQKTRKELNQHGQAK